MLARHGVPQPPAERGGLSDRRPDGAEGANVAPLGPRPPPHPHAHAGKDPEIQLPRPISLWRVAGEVIRLRQPYVFLRAAIAHAFGRISDEVKELPESEHHKLVSGARVYVAVYLAIFAWAVAIGSWLPILCFFVPRIYGAWLHTLLTFTQHAGLAENVRDHRRNSRDVYMNPLFAFLYWNMNYHIEHHIYPLVPFHALPALHEEIKDQLPAAHDGLAATYREIVATFWRQRRDPSYFRDPAVQNSGSLATSPAE